MNQDIIEAFNKFAEQYADFTFNNNLLQYELNRFISLLPKNGKILDAGCGSGRDVQYFLDEDLNAIGIDASEKLILEAQERVKQGEFKVMDFRKMSFKDNSFDGIWSMASLYHIAPKEMAKTLKEFFRVLDENGILYLAVYEGSGKKEMDDPNYKEKRTFYYYNQEKIQKYLEDAGFSIIKSEVNDTEEHRWLEVYARKNV